MFILPSRSTGNRPQLSGTVYPLCLEMVQIQTPVSLFKGSRLEVPSKIVPEESCCSHSAPFELGEGPKAEW